NGIGHWWGYRSFETADASRNFMPWGVLIGGEELHNNHHTYPTSAKLSVKPYEFDIGWAYIRILEALRLASVHRVAPRLRLGSAQATPDGKTLEAISTHRHEVMARYARRVRSAAGVELRRMRVDRADANRVAAIKLARRWLHRDAERIPVGAKRQ